MKTITLKTITDGDTLLTEKAIEIGENDKLIAIVPNTVTVEQAGRLHEGLENLLSGKSSTFILNENVKLQVISVQ